MDRKPFTMIFVLMDRFNGVIKIEHVKESNTHEGAIYACTTNNETYIFPLSSIDYAKLIEEKEEEESGTKEAD